MTADHIPPKRIFPEAKVDAQAAKHVPSSPQTESAAYKLAYQDIDFLLKSPWLRGSRIQLRVDNLFNARQRVTDENGVVPSAYVPNLVDPLGRVVRLTFRKQFF